MKNKNPKTTANDDRNKDLLQKNFGNRQKQQQPIYYLYSKSRQPFLWMIWKTNTDHFN